VIHKNGLGSTYKPPYVQSPPPSLLPVLVGEGLGEASAGVEVDSAEECSTNLAASGEGVELTVGDGDGLSCSAEEVGPTGGDEVGV
jgi:hypothetical protein